MEHLDESRRGGLAGARGSTSPGTARGCTAGFADVSPSRCRSILPGGGFAYQAADGSPMPGRRPQLFLTARMAYTAAIGVRHGVPGSGELLDHAMASLTGLHADTEHGGWLSEPGAVTRKATYDHVHVGLASAGALTVGHPAAAALLEQVVDVIDTPPLGRPRPRRLRESFAPDWSDSEDYRGANANMHGLEAFIAMGHATGDAVWHERGLAIADRLINLAARERDWLLPEHFTADWQVLPDYNRDEPLHPFRPYGATFGHSLEWARFLLQLDASPLVGSPSWLVEAADGLTRRALDGGWALDGRPGLVYTVDWDGAPVADVRLHWPVCEGIQTTRGAPAPHRRPALGGLVPPPVGPRRPLLHRRARHVAQRARRRHARGGHGLARPTRRLPLRRRAHDPARGLTARRPEGPVRGGSAQHDEGVDVLPGRSGSDVASHLNAAGPLEPPSPVRIGDVRGIPPGADAHHRRARGQAGRVEHAPHPVDRDLHHGVGVHRRQAGRVHGDVAGRHPEGAGHRDDQVGVVAAHPLPGAQRHERVVGRRRRPREVEEALVDPGTTR